VAEGLSNVRRHTSSTQATIVLARDNGLLLLRIANAGGAPTLHLVLNHGACPGTGWARAGGAGPGR
jgi:signal transduction histidine kinase